MSFGWPEPFILPSLVTAISTILVVTAGLLCIAGSRHLSTIFSRKIVKLPAEVPYIIPFLGHYIDFCYKEPLRWIEHISSKNSYQIFAAYIWGRTFYMLSKEDFIETIFTYHGASLSFAPVRSYLLVNVFGAERSQTEASTAAVEDVLSCLKRHARGEDSSRLVSRLVRILQEDGPNLVSFSESVVDESSWERTSNPRFISTKDNSDETEMCPAVEVDMFALIRNFVGHMTIKALMGNDWSDSQSTFVDVLWNFDNGWRSMLMALPRWLPIPGLSRAYIARRRLCKSLISFHRAMDSHAANETSSPMSFDFDEVSSLLKDRCSIWRAHRTVESVKASADLSLLWAAIVKPGNLIFWMLLYIYSSPSLVSDIRLEISSYVHAIQPPNTFGISEPPRLVFTDIDGLSDACPILKAVFFESLRLHCRPLSVRKVTRNFSFTHNCNNTPQSAAPQRFELESGAYLVATFGLQDPRFVTRKFDENFNLSRYLSVDQNGKQRCNDTTAHFWGLGEAACPGRTFAQKQVMVFVATILSLWEISPSSGGNWEIPKAHATHVVVRPEKEIRISVRTRKLGTKG